MANEENRSGTTWLCIGTYATGKTAGEEICLWELSLQPPDTWQAAQRLSIRVSFAAHS